MYDFSSICIVGFLVLGTYKLVELFVKKKERLAIIEKLFTFSEKKEMPGSFRLPSLSFGNNDSGSWTLRIALLLIGVGLGCLLSFIFIAFYQTNMEQIDYDLKGFSTFSFIAIFGGLGLLTAYLIEKKQLEKKE
ncbi:MAG: hypothetical protein LBT50_09385 [Prevotellaceae bacterium]|jgi:hypothetical protein|nr:hypothetical protein [Prevotellaceae bacterium]